MLTNIVCKNMSPTKPCFQLSTCFLRRHYGNLRREQGCSCGTFCDSTGLSSAMMRQLTHSAQRILCPMRSCNPLEIRWILMLAAKRTAGGREHNRTTPRSIDPNLSVCSLDRTINGNSSLLSAQPPISPPDPGPHTRHFTLQRKHVAPRSNLFRANVRVLLST